MADLQRSSAAACSLVPPPHLLHLVAVNILSLSAASSGFPGSGDPLALSCVVAPRSCMRLASSSPAFTYHESDSENCFFCDSRGRGGHGIENVISRNGPGGKQRVTFRPAALLLEHSVDHGHSWHVDQYFAHNCSGLFPGIPPASATVSDAVCDQHYSDMEPSTEGKFLHVTNIHVNAKLHTLGDRPPGGLKGHPFYYYALYELVARGSYLCHGHGSECRPAPGAIANAKVMIFLSSLHPPTLSVQPEFWGVSSDPLGCRPCDCDFGGAYSNRCSTGEGLCAAPISMATAAMNSSQGTSALPSTRLLLKPSLARASSQLTPSCLAVVLSRPFCSEPGTRYSMTLWLWRTKGAQRPERGTILLDLVTRQCPCQEGFGGRTRSWCQDGYWGDPDQECRAALLSQEAMLGAQMAATLGGPNSILEQAREAQQ
ncbi:Laminin subunit beta-4 [Pteropus alecto]|uniref:Laminin subunit beta-4 n=1 Tax=Pteropus alecto TaxID=9402 RepID=L5KWA2_PTEAL|nr:Laminin subunit beta-4 [Pteropus alecto]